VAVFDDRLEIANEGLLPSGLSIADLKRDHLSRPRNPLIAEVFYLRGLVERWGRGTQKIVELCVQAGHPEPEFSQVTRSTVIRFTPSGYVAPHRVQHDLNQRQREILHALSQATDLPLRTVMAHLTEKVSGTRVHHELAQLRTLGLVQSRGHGRGAVWFLIKAPE
jgi:ATP-dependent DNA helicase RecG